MDNFDRQFGEMFSQITQEKIPAGFSAKVLKKIEVEKERRIKLKEELFQWLFISISAIILCLSMFLLNKYYFHEELSSLSVLIRTKLLDIKDMFKGESVSLWSTIGWLIIGANTIILILLEQFLSRIFSEKLKRN